MRRLYIYIAARPVISSVEMKRGATKTHLAGWSECYTHHVHHQTDSNFDTFLHIEYLAVHLESPDGRMAAISGYETVGSLIFGPLPCALLKEPVPSCELPAAIRLGGW